MEHRKYDGILVLFVGCQCRFSLIFEVCSKFCVGSKVTTHPHLSQALMGSETSSTGSTAAAASASTSSINSLQPSTSGAQASNTSLIKSLLATKVGETGMTSTQPAGMSGNITSYNTDVSNIQQVSRPASQAV